MDPSLTAALIAAGTGAASAFIAYWWGYGNAHREGRLRVLQLRAQMHEQQAIALDLADALYRMRHPHGLTPSEQAAFNDMAHRYGKESA